MDEKVNMKIRDIKGIGEKTEKLFNKIGIYEAEDLINYYPRDYDEFSSPIMVSELDNERKAAIRGKIIGALQIKNVRNLSILTTICQSEDGEKFNVKWFNMNFLRSQLKKNQEYVFRGKISYDFKKELSIEQPELYTVTDYEKIRGNLKPIYPLTEGLTNNLIMKTVKEVLINHNIDKDYLPSNIIKKYDLLSYKEAINHIHYPRDFFDMQMARKRLAFDEFLLFIASLKLIKDEDAGKTNNYIIKRDKKTLEFIDNLPYKLTDGQNNVIKEISEDMQSKKVMHRLVQGDVGSGKTILSIIALLDTVYSGYQGAMMAPTEVLARQHYEGILELFAAANIDIRVGILTGSMTKKEKREALKMISEGEYDIVIGTHAVIEDKVIYKNLALVITDEQHRFGVKQRERFSNKGENPHILVMSATPIPRTLGIILYGDLEVSTLLHLPKGRLPIKNCVVDTSYRKTAYKFIEDEVRKGHQAYVICPMIEEGEDDKNSDVINYTETLRENLSSDIRVEYLHGKMKNQEKNHIMEEFSKNNIQVLVSTTVIEVGVNVPNSTVMMIENAERFGLSTLHQLRGRVGRGNAQSYCIFISASKKKETLKRLEILNKSNDGFEIARWDLSLRGPGDFFGIRQSGEMDFKIANIYSDHETLLMAKEATDEALMDNEFKKQLDIYMQNKFSLNL